MMDLEEAKTLLIILAMILSQPFGGVGVVNAKQNQNVQVLVQQLWSPDQSVRLTAKGKLAEIGSSAAPHLISLLTDLAAHSALPHFATGKEEEGQKYLREPGHDDLREYVITWRLIYDCVELLGDMKSAEAVPSIIQIMEQHPTIKVLETYTRDMKALVKIGEPAVEPLINVIKNAAAIAEAIAADPARRQVADATGPPKVLADRIRVRAAVVLGDIGDPRALSTLKELIKQGGPFERGDVNVQNAIKQIRLRLSKK
jgi:HEAT repeat protein